MQITSEVRDSINPQLDASIGEVGVFQEYEFSPLHREISEDLFQSDPLPLYPSDPHQSYTIEPSATVTVSNAPATGYQYFVNGMNMSPEHIQHTAQLLADSTGKTTIVVPNDKEVSPLIDFTNSALMTFNSTLAEFAEPDAIQTLTQFFIAEARNGDGPISLVGYSAGNLIIDAALDKMKAEFFAGDSEEFDAFTARLDITHFGTPNFTAPLNATQHAFCHSDDLVAQLGVPVSIGQIARDLLYGELNGVAETVELDLPRTEGSGIIDHFVASHSINAYLENYPEFVLTALRFCSPSEARDQLVSSIADGKLSDTTHREILSLIANPDSSELLEQNGGLQPVEQRLLAGAVLNAYYAGELGSFEPGARLLAQLECCL